MNSNQNTPMKLIHCFPLPTNNEGISYTALSIYKEQRKVFNNVHLVTPVIQRNAFGLGIIQTAPFYLRKLPWKYMKRLVLDSYYAKLVELAGPRVVFDLWSDHPPAVLKALKQQGAMIVKEKFNTAQKSAKHILSSEYARHGMPDRCSITEASIDSELRQLDLADYVFSPSPMVSESLTNLGISSRKILESSFGWDTASLDNHSGPVITQYPKPRFLFVGSVEIRKGAHLLLEYWKAAECKGTLIFMGRVKDEMKPIIERIGAKNVVFLGHQEKAYGVYEQASVFVFPSLEEGSPLVSYEALARGLPCLVSPMGAGTVVRNGIDGLVINPHDRAEWIKAIRSMAGEPNSLHHASRFTWGNVAKQRYTELVRALPVSAAPLDATSTGSN